MSKLIVFVTCQRTGSSISAEIFHQHGMSLGPFHFFMAKPENPVVFYIYWICLVSFLRNRYSFP